MPTWFSLIPWKLVAVVVFCLVISGLWFRGDHYMKQAASLGAQLDSAIDVANTNSKIAQDQARIGQAAQQIIATGEQKKQTIRKQADVTREEIAHAPSEDDGALAPVLRRELDRLQPPLTGPANRS